MTTPLHEHEDEDSPEIPHTSEDPVDTGVKVRIRGVGTVTQPEV